MYRERVESYRLLPSPLQLCVDYGSLLEPDLQLIRRALQMYEVRHCEVLEKRDDEPRSTPCES